MDSPFHLKRQGKISYFPTGMWCGLWLRQQQKHNAFLRGEEVVLAQGE